MGLRPRSLWITVLVAQVLLKCTETKGRTRKRSPDAVLMNFFACGAPDCDEQSTPRPFNGSCATSICDSKYDNVLSSIDVSVDPCDDFYGYVCSNHTRIDTADQTIADFLERGMPSNTAEAQAQIFYESCRTQNEDPQDDMNAKALEDMIQDLGGWQLTEPSTDIDITHLVERAHVKYGVNVFFSWSVNFDPYNTSRYTLLITPEDSESGYLRQILAEHDPEGREEFEKELVEMMKATDHAGAGRETDDRLLMLVRDVTRLNSQLQNSVFSQPSYEKMSVADLAPSLSFLNLTAYFSEPFGTSGRPITNKTIIGVYNVESLARLSKVIERNIQAPAGQRAIVNYIRMRALFHLSANFETDTESIDDVCREICFRRLMQVMNSIFVKRTIPKSSRAKQEVTDLFDAIKEAFSIKISNMVWLDNSTREIALERVENVTILAGYPDLYFNESYWEKKYSVLDLDPMSYMENVLKIQRFNLLEAAYELQSSAKKSHVFDLLSAKKTTAFYMESLNAVFVHAGLMQEPYYHDDYPKPVRLAALSFILSRELVKAFFVPDAHADQEDSWMTPESFAEFQNLSRCFEEQYAVFNTSETQMDEYELDDSMADYSGLSLGYEVYHSSSNSSEFDEITPEVDWNQYYFIEFAHYLCNDITPQTSNHRRLLPPKAGLIRWDL